MSRAGAACSCRKRNAIASPTRCGSPKRSAARLSPSGQRNRIAEDVIDYAQANNVTQIVIGKSARTRWFEILHGSVVHDLVRRSGNISVHVIAGDTVPASRFLRRPLAPPSATKSSNPRPYVGA